MTDQKCYDKSDYVSIYLPHVGNESPKVIFTLAHQKFSRLQKGLETTMTKPSSCPIFSWGRNPHAYI